MLAQEDLISAVVELDLVHETPHEEDPPPVGGFSVDFVRRVGQGGQVEARPFVGDGDLDGIFGEVTLDVDRLGGVHLVAMLDRVDQGFFECEVDAEAVPFSPAGFLEVVEHLIAQRPGGSRVAGDRLIKAPEPPRISHNENGGLAPRVKRTKWLWDVRAKRRPGPLLPSL